MRGKWGTGLKRGKCDARSQRSEASRWFRDDCDWASSSVLIRSGVPAHDILSMIIIVLFSVQDDDKDMIWGRFASKSSSENETSWLYYSLVGAL